jgi:hypothetical protein
VPKAVTRADRMAMKGQKLDLQGFKNNFEEELNTVKGNLHNFHNEARPLVYKTRDFAGDIFTHFGNFLGGAGKVIGQAGCYCAYRKLLCRYNRRYCSNGICLCLWQPPYEYLPDIPF